MYDYEQLPKDPVILLSFVNTKLRDSFSTLDSFCQNYRIERETLEEKMKSVSREYDEKTNQFI